MSVKINVGWHLQRFTTSGQRVVETVGQNVGECLENLEVQFPGIKEKLCVGQRRLNGPYQIYVKSANLYTTKLAEPVKENDELTIQFMAHGG